MENDEDLGAAIDRALRGAALPGAHEAQSGVTLHASDPPQPLDVPSMLPFDDGD
jgi:hypothetical protein